MKQCRHCNKNFEGVFCPHCGEYWTEDKTSNTQVPEEREPIIEESEALLEYSKGSREEEPKILSEEQETSKWVLNENSKFCGTVLGWFGINFLVFWGTVLTLGIAYPWLVCMRQRYIASHTLINGQSLYFDGRGIQLIGKYICWFLLTVITFGIYGFWLNIKMQKWITKHTHFVGIENGESKFSGGLLALFGIKFVSRLVTVLTLGIASSWMHCWKERYYTKHTEIDGHQLKFNGTGAQYWGKRFVWLLLTIITFGIYALFRALREKQWVAKHTVLKEWSKIQSTADTPIKKTTNTPAFLGIIFSFIGAFLRTFCASIGTVASNSATRTDLETAIFIGSYLICILITIVALILSIVGLASLKKYKEEGKAYAILGIVMAGIQLL